MMSAEECRACSAIWEQRGRALNISIQRATTFLALSRLWTSLAEQKDRLTAIEKEEDEWAASVGSLAATDAVGAQPPR
jgi:hypothetical protein